jgi:hypothetical protein
MKRVAFAAAAAGGAAFALHRLAPKVRETHAHCREMTRTRCDATTAGSQPQQTPPCA